MIVVLTVKMWPWKPHKVQDERDSWDAPRKPIYILRDMKERVFVGSVVV